MTAERDMSGGSNLEAEVLLDLSEELIWQFVLRHLAEIRSITKRMHDTEFRFGMEHALDELDIRLTREEYNACLDRALQPNPEPVA